MTLQLAEHIAGPYSETGIRFEQGENEFADQIYMHDPSEHEDGGFYSITDWDADNLQSYLKQASREKNNPIPDDKQPL